MVLEQYLANDYLRALSILVIFFIIIKIPVYFAKKILLKLTLKTKTKVDNLIVDATNSPISLIIILFGIQIALKEISLPYLDIVAKIAATFIILTIFLIAGRIFNILMENWGKKIVSKTKSSIDDNLLNLSHRFIKIVMIILAIMYTLSFWNIEITPLLASLGIGGIAIAFALQSTLGNIFGGISLLLDKSVKVGDRIQLESGESAI